MVSDSTPNNLLRDERGVSETVGFLLVLMIITIAVGIIAVAGNPMLEEAKADAYMQNMQDAFQMLHRSVGEVARDNAPIKTRGISIYDGTLTLQPNTTNLTIIVEKNSTVEQYNDTVSLGRLVFKSRGQGVVLEGGALISDYASGMVGSASPPIYYDEQEDVLVITVVDLEEEAEEPAEGVVEEEAEEEAEEEVLKKGDENSISGSGRVEVIARQAPPNNMYNSMKKENVTLVIHSEYAPAWKRMLEAEGFTVTGDTGTVRATYNNVFVRLKHQGVLLSVEAIG